MGTREPQTRRARRRIYLQHLALAFSLAFVTGQAAAKHNDDHDPGPKGPRASLLSSTTCAIDDDTLVVTTTLTNKSSSDIVPEVRGGYLGGRYKTRGEPGNATQSFGDVAISTLTLVPANVDPDFTVSTSFSLCDGQMVSSQVLSARELNGESVIEYGISDGSEESRTVENRCTADPVTGEGGGIKVADVIDDIEAACAM